MARDPQAGDEGEKAVPRERADAHKTLHGGQRWVAGVHHQPWDASVEGASAQTIWGPGDTGNPGLPCLPTEQET